MEEIHVYRKDWKGILAAIICMAFTIAAIVFLLHGKREALGTLLFFGLCVLFDLFVLIRQRRHPYLIIREKNFSVNAEWKFGGCRYREQPFAEVERFELLPFYLFRPLNRDICAYLKMGGNQQKQFSDTLFGRIGRKVFSGNKYYIPIPGIDMKPQLLCYLLNERLKR